jgi:DNA invertase Pin-like site-specific DNA recombinase
MSTEHQQYSTENQSEIIREYAEQRGMIIVRTYADAGKSGLRIHSRNALKQLIQDVETDSADFSAILVYDVSLGLDELYHSEPIFLTSSYIT